MCLQLYLLLYLKQKLVDGSNTYDWASEHYRICTLKNEMAFTVHKMTGKLKKSLPTEIVNAMCMIVSKVSKQGIQKA